VNGKPTRALDAVGHVRIVLFSPEDVGLITGPPSGRRRYLDLLLSQIDNRYVRSLARYNRILEQRNSLLKTLSKESRGGGATATSQLAFWNDELLTYGSYLVARRAMVCAGLATSAKSRYAEFSGSGELTLAYQASVSAGFIGDDRCNDVEFVRAVAQRAFEQRLDDSRADELRRGVSLAGPHRDDVTMLLDQMPIGTYGSRGQQRLAVVALKLAEADRMLAETGETSVILLDDVLSELDSRHRERLLEAVCAAGAQLIITSTDRELLEFPFLEHVPLARAVPGALERIA
jgi:DNA replication and repair protein RecF